MTNFSPNRIPKSVVVSHDRRAYVDFSNYKLVMKPWDLSEMTIFESKFGRANSIYFSSFIGFLLDALAVWSRISFAVQAPPVCKLFHMAETMWSDFQIFFKKSTLFA